MKQYLSKGHIEILNSIIAYLPKYDTFYLKEISSKISQIDEKYSDDAFLLSKFTASHGEIFTELWLNGLIEITDKEKGVFKLTADGHKLKDIGNYNKYIEQLNAEYKARRSESFVKTYWWLPAIFSFILGLSYNFFKTEEIVKSKPCSIHEKSVPMKLPAGTNAINIAGTTFGDQVSFTSSTSGPTVTDVDGNIYKTVTIGTQVWLASNLKTTKLKDRTRIPLVTGNSAWANLTTSGYCWYSNDAAANKNTYGALYNWYTVNTVKLCPAGWHVPTDPEWTTLTTFLGGEGVAGGKLKETGTGHWVSPNTGATNEIGFTALPGGYRGDNGTFYDVGSYGGWWSSTAGGASSAWGRGLFHVNADVGRGYSGGSGKQDGFSVRCVRD